MQSKSPDFFKSNTRVAIFPEHSSLYNLDYRDSDNVRYDSILVRGDKNPELQIVDHYELTYVPKECADDAEDDFVAGHIEATLPDAGKNLYTSDSVGRLVSHTLRASLRDQENLSIDRLSESNEDGSINIIILTDHASGSQDMISVEVADDQLIVDFAIETAEDLAIEYRRLDAQFGGELMSVLIEMIENIEPLSQKPSSVYLEIGRPEPQKIGRFETVMIESYANLQRFYDHDLPAADRNIDWADLEKQTEGYKPEVQHEIASLAIRTAHNSKTEVTDWLIQSIADSIHALRV